MTIEEIREEVHQYQKELEIPVPLEINYCLERLSYLSGIHSRTGYIAQCQEKYANSERKSA
jgi:hypothetical protein